MLRELPWCATKNKGSMSALMTWGLGCFLRCSTKKCAHSRYGAWSRMTSHAHCLARQWPLGGKGIWPTLEGNPDLPCRIILKQPCWSKERLRCCWRYETPTLQRAELRWLLRSGEEWQEKFRTSLPSAERRPKILCLGFLPAEGK